MRSEERPKYAQETEASQWPNLWQEKIGRKYMAQRAIVALILCFGSACNPGLISGIGSAVRQALGLVGIALDVLLIFLSFGMKQWRISILLGVCAYSGLALFDIALAIVLRAWSFVSVLYLFLLCVFSVVLCLIAGKTLRETDSPAS